MAAALPVDPETSKPIVYPVVIVGPGKAHNDKTTLSQNGKIELELDSDERHLFDGIIKACKAWEDGVVEGFSPLKLQVRVAGGWVRDKVLGLNTHDVDIALDACTGVEFARCMKQFMEQHEDQKLGKIGVIAANPAQSKHLETATMKVFGIEVDFCNLRAESYAEDSRIPTTMVGTPLEDSYRRDLTMNALYYNLHTNKIEDWTRRGLKDLLETKVATTPLEAYQTFHDDPLRVLRAIRFAVRYDMQLSEELQTASMNLQIHEELHRKVSRERVGKELEGMLSGKHANPIEALKLICRLKLAGSVFCIPADEVLLGNISKLHLDMIPYQQDKKEDRDYLIGVAWEEAFECIQALLPVLQCVQSNSSNARISFDPRLTYLAVTILPFGKLMYVEKKKSKTVIEFMIREGIKFKNKDVINVISIFNQVDAMKDLMHRVPESNPSTRLEAGLILREAKDMWVTVLVLATVSLLRQKPNECDWCARAQQWHEAIVTELSLEECWKVKPLLNGKEIIELLGLPKGPIVGTYAQEQTKWILMNPTGTLEECKEFLTTYKKKRDYEQNQAAEPVAKKVHL